MTFDYDAFLSYHREDATIVAGIAHRLTQEAQLQVCLDQWRLLPGESWPARVGQTLDRSATCVVFVGPHGSSPWVHSPLAVALKQRTQAWMLRVVPVLLPGGDKDQEGLPSFWKSVTWVDYTAGLDDENAFELLKAAICGYTPDSHPTTTQTDHPAEHTPGPKLAHALLPVAGFQDRLELNQLRAFWADERGVGMVALVGMGGSGKTALASHFLQELPDSGLDHPDVPKNTDLRPAGDVFAWSFYEQPNVELFMQALHTYLTGQEVISRPARDLTYQVIRAMEQSLFGRVLIVLDGLEAVQERQDSPGGFGLLRDSSLRHLVRRVAQGGLGVRMLVTSRFPLPELSPFVGSSYRLIETDRLDATSARRLLRVRGVAGSEADLDTLIEAFDTHALTLDQLGTLLRDFFGGDPQQAQALPPLKTDRGDEAAEVQARRLARIFSFYRQHLPADELDLLQTLCVFRIPVATSVLTAILTGDRPERPLALPRLNEVTLRSLLAHLSRRRLISFYGDEHQTLCAVHPSVRDYFYQALGQAGGGIHTAVCEYLTPLVERPYRERYPLDPDSLDIYEEQIYHTTQSGDVGKAVYLYGWLGGYQHLAWRLADYQRGLRLTSILVEAGGMLQTNQLCAWHDRSLFHLNLGRPTLAEAQLRELLSDYQAQSRHRQTLLDRLRHDQAYHPTSEEIEQLTLAMRWARDDAAWFYYQAAILQSLGDALLAQGKLVEAEQVAGSVIAKVGEEQWLEKGHVAFESGSNPFGRRAVARSLSGQVSAALADFHLAETFHEQLSRWSQERVFFGGVHIAHYALLLARLVKLPAALALLRQCNLTSARKFQPLLAAQYELAFAEIYQIAQEYAGATPYIDAALAWAVQSGHQETYARANLAKARGLLRAGQLPETQAALQEAEQVARTCTFKICLVDVLVVAGHHALQAGQLDRAAQLANEALDLSAEAQCGYQWGSGNAAHLLAEIEIERGHLPAAANQARVALKIRTPLQDPKLSNTLALLERLNPPKGAP
ncbi:MAG: toll/interleukin-1 receptor domain-containing protein [Chloroflexi bacterium]|nr:toll/interleukin-1 receptor domain-containing protein [Chloroflexota bacterium]